MSLTRSSTRCFQQTLTYSEHIAWACQVCPASSSSSHQVVIGGQVLMMFPTWVLKSPSRMTESPRGTPPSTPNRDTKKARYSSPLPGP
ncbi:hypothetical protein ILYODFUR_034034 [Ilyodon furcidens]|uniref:Uncharacterized protein n=1 Tax=Ilyodon furcidens TaxID=33524 RepID=A0ABV0SRF7_9TELE